MVQKVDGLKRGERGISFCCIKSQSAHRHVASAFLFALESMKTTSTPNSSHCKLICLTIGVRVSTLYALGRYPSTK